MWTRHVDGSGTDPDHSDWGQAGIRLLRTLLLDNDPGEISTGPAGADRPAPRAVSNAVAAQPWGMPSSVRASSML